MSHITYTAISFAIILGFLYYFTEEGFERLKEKIKYISLGAGISTAYLFLNLLPDVYRRFIHTNSEFLFVWVLIGFVILHLTDKHIYLHHPGESRGRKIEKMEIIFSLAYNLIAGIILVNILEKDILAGYLFILPLIFHITASTIPHSHRENRTMRLILSASALTGVLISLYLTMPEILILSLLGVITGSFLFMDTRKLIPLGEKGSPLYFLLGAVIYTLILSVIGGI